MCNKHIDVSLIIVSPAICMMQLAMTSCVLYSHLWWIEWYREYNGLIVGGKSWLLAVIYITVHCCAIFNNGSYYQFGTCAALSVIEMTTRAIYARWKLTKLKNWIIIFSYWVNWLDSAAGTFCHVQYYIHFRDIQHALMIIFFLNELNFRRTRTFTFPIRQRLQCCLQKQELFSGYFCLTSPVPEELRSFFIKIILQSPSILQGQK